MAEKFIEMEVREIHLVGNEGEAVVILHEKEGLRSFPIFIGIFEAYALELAARKQRAERPLTHDLILNVLHDLGAKLLRVLVVELRGGTFIGALEVLTSLGSVVRVDARPSDSMVLAMKCQVPIFVEEQVLAEVGNIDNEDEEVGLEFEDDEDADLGYNDENDEPEDPDWPDEQR